jgi:hypothetical protein
MVQGLSLPLACLQVTFARNDYLREFTDKALHPLGNCASVFMCMLLIVRTSGRPRSIFSLEERFFSFGIGSRRNQAALTERCRRRRRK